MNEIAKITAHKRYISRFPSYSFISDGTVISASRREPFAMKPIKMGAYVGLQLKADDGALRKEYLHRLICEAFHGPCPDGHVCRHLDGDKTNNSASNLAWGTQSQNNKDKAKHGTSPDGERNPRAKLKSGDVLAMREMRLHTSASFKEIANLFNVSTMTAYRAVTRQSWSTT